jgi:outer membrane immunogenic protein
MTQLKAAPLGLALGFLSVLVANAADLPPPMAYPVYVPAPAFTWAGPYVGATAGYANGFHSFNDLAGAFLGYPGLSSDQTGASPRAERLGIIFKLAVLSTE